MDLDSWGRGEEGSFLLLFFEFQELQLDPFCLLLYIFGLLCFGWWVVLDSQELHHFESQVLLYHLMNINNNGT